VEQGSIRDSSSEKNHVLDQPVENPGLRQGYALDRRRRRLPMNPLTLGEKLA
jgi:hypothetical protein